MRFTVDRLDHIVITCTDVEIAATWYERVLGMDRQDYGPEGRCALTFGGQKINLRAIDDLDWEAGRHAQPGTEALCFITAVGPEEAVGHLHAHGIAIEHGPTRRMGALGEIACVTCRDPDGNLIEIASYLP
jgi:catechol 2,3-dioxygenase-like lactoylglutathione lyase family enzyme